MSAPVLKALAFPLALASMPLGFLLGDAYGSSHVQATMAEATVERLKASQVETYKVVSDMQDAAAKRTAELITLRKAIDNAPNSSVCASSPPIRVLLNGMRKGGRPVGHLPVTRHGP